MYQEEKILETDALSLTLCNSPMVHSFDERKGSSAATMSGKGRQ